MAIDNRQAVLSLFSGMAKARLNDLALKRQQKASENSGKVTDQQKEQMKYLEGIVKNENSTPEEIKMAQDKLQGLHGLDFSPDYTQEAQTRQENKATEQELKVQKALLEIENLGKRGKLTDAQIAKTKKNLSKGSPDFLNQIDKSIDNYRQLLKKTKDRSGNLVVDQSDPENIRILKEINRLEGVRLNEIEKSSGVKVTPDKTAKKGNSLRERANAHLEELLKKYPEQEAWRMFKESEIGKEYYSDKKVNEYSQTPPVERAWGAQ